MNKKLFNSISQFALPFFTISGFALTSLKYPEWGLVFALFSQPFWLYSSHRAYKNAGQIGLFISSIIMTFIIVLGIINYWFL